jgi:hypothetical protein
VSVRYAEWDLSMVHLVDNRTGALLAPLYGNPSTNGD